MEKIKYLLGAMGLFVGVILISVFISKAIPKQNVGDTFGSYIPITVSTSTSIATSSTLVLGASSARRYAIFVNDSANVVYLSAAGTSTAGKGIRLNASGGTYEINTLNPIISAIYAIVSTGTSSLTVTASQ